ncbi:hypothetical protein ACRBEV_02695 [Methylobacterium phyllosphaerae]
MGSLVQNRVGTGLHVEVEIGDQVGLRVGGLGMWVSMWGRRRLWTTPENTPAGKGLRDRTARDGPFFRARAPRPCGEGNFATGLGVGNLPF